MFFSGSSAFLFQKSCCNQLNNMFFSMFLPFGAYGTTSIGLANLSTKKKPVGCDTRKNLPAN